jgi:sugar diacid utilization regulator
MLERLFGIRPHDPRDAAEQLRSAELLADAGSYTVIALSARDGDANLAPEPIRVRLAAAMGRGRRRVHPGHWLVLLAPKHVAGLIAFDDAHEPNRQCEQVVGDVQAALADEGGWSVVVGMGEPVEAAWELRRCYEQALHALSLATSVAELGPVARWADLGAYRLIATLADSRDVRRDLPASLTRLLEADDTHELVPTLESYLEHGGDAQATAKTLFIHRSTLYTRLRRIEKRGSVDLSAGDDRLELHLGLRLWHIAGQPPPS